MTRDGTRPPNFSRCPKLVNHPNPTNSRLSSLMPSKRNIVPNTTEETPTKRHTRSSGPVLVETQSPTIVTATPATKRKAPIRTYGRNKRDDLAVDNSLKETQSRESLGKSARVNGGSGVAGDEESSEDELNLTQPSKLLRKANKPPTVWSDIDSSVGKRIGGTRPGLDTETSTRKPGRVKRIDTHSTKPISSRPAQETSDMESDEPTPSVSPRNLQISVKSVVQNQAIDSPRSTKRLKNKIQTTDEASRSEDLISATVLTHRRITGSSPIKSPVKSLVTRKLAKRKQLEHINMSDAPPLTPMKRPGRLPKRGTEKDNESSSPGPSPKKLRFDADITPSPPNAKLHQTSHTSSRSSSPTDLALEPISNLPSTHKAGILTPSHIYPSKRSAPKHSTHTHLTGTLPLHLHSCLNAQKRALLHTLQCSNRSPNDDDEEENNEEVEEETNDVAFQQLHKLLMGTVNRGEGNSCLVLGPRGSGKTRVFAFKLNKYSILNHYIRSSSNNVYLRFRISLSYSGYQVGHSSPIALQCERLHTSLVNRLGRLSLLTQMLRLKVLIVMMRMMSRTPSSINPQT